MLSNCLDKAGGKKFHFISSERVYGTHRAFVTVSKCFFGIRQGHSRPSAPPAAPGRTRSGESTGIFSAPRNKNRSRFIDNLTPYSYSYSLHVILEDRSF